MELWKAQSRLKKLKPNAVDIRPEGRCPSCKRRDVLLSWSTDEWQAAPFRDSDGEMVEYCGHWCSACGWDGATRRTSYEYVDTESK